MSRTAYHLFLVDGAILNGNASSSAGPRTALEGETDAEGYTDFAITDVLEEHRRWVLLQRVGNGPFGRSFEMTFIGTDQPSVRARYVVVNRKARICYQGVSDEKGRTALFASEEEGVVFALYAGTPRTCASMRRIKLH